MKNLLFSLLVASFFVVSCKKKSEDTPSPTYTQDKLNGTWENSVKDKNGCTNQLLITASSMSEKSICTGSTATVPYQSYAFDGRKITAVAMGMNVEYVIEELSDVKLVVTMNALGTSEKLEYKKK